MLRSLADRTFHRTGPDRAGAGPRLRGLREVHGEVRQELAQRAAGSSQGAKCYMVIYDNLYPLL